MKKLSIVAAALLTAGAFEFAVANTQPTNVNTPTKFHISVNDTIPVKKTPAPLPLPSPTPAPTPAPSPTPTPSPNPTPTPSPTPTPVPAPPHQ